MADYLRAVRKEYEQFIEDNADLPLEDVKEELRELINKIIKATRRGTVNELEDEFRNAGF